METIEAKRISETEIVLKYSEDIENCMEEILEEKTFILKYEEEGQSISECMSGQVLRPKIKDGSLRLISEESDEDDNKDDSEDYEDEDEE